MGKIQATQLYLLYIQCHQPISLGILLCTYSLHNTAKQHRLICIHTVQVLTQFSCKSGHTEKLQSQWLVPLPVCRLPQVDQTQESSRRPLQIKLSSFKCNKTHTLSTSVSYLLQSKPLKWIALGPDRHEYTLVHASYFMTNDIHLSGLSTEAVSTQRGLTVVPGFQVEE